MKSVFPIRTAFWVCPRLRRGRSFRPLGDGALLFEEAREFHEEAVLTLFDVGDALRGGGDRRGRRHQGQRHVGISSRMEQRRSDERAERPVRRLAAFAHAGGNHLFERP